MVRSWTEVGGSLVERLGGRETVERKIARLKWQVIPEDGSLEVGFMPGQAIKTVISEFRLPKVSAVAIDSFSRPEFHPGFYAIRASYKNGDAVIYVLDTGTGVTPVCSDFEPRVWSEEETVEFLARKPGLFSATKRPKRPGAILS